MRYGDQLEMMGSLDRGNGNTWHNTKLHPW